MTAALDAIRARHVPIGGDLDRICRADDLDWPCIVEQYARALDRAEAVVAAAREYLRFGTHHDLDRLREGLRAYEDADKVADIAEAAWEEKP